ncbi:hypothetical protein RFW18_13915 [Metabacillus idriensis]|uniref:hypothetical protein n=1 Tax=Metabacillus idriensis TaxID=324768 RepID=UPI0028133055|nr:hypothetical protein [Metabacillus idriensis]MDR0138847.1 hypothetical protein [Metabacillus idriensis]
MKKIHIVNTNQSRNPACEQDMLLKRKCSAYFKDWKHHIENIQPYDIVFLYSNKKGIIAKGLATGILEIADYEGHKNEEYYMNLDRFEILKKPFPASEVRVISGIDVVFGNTMFTFKNYDTGIKLWQTITKNYL